MPCCGGAWGAYVMVVSINSYFNNTTSVAERISMTSNLLSNSFNRISSGSFSTKDSPANTLLITEYANYLVSSNSVAKNISDGASLSYTADNALSSIYASVSRARALAVQAANETLSDDDRSIVLAEYNQLVSGINNTIANTTYNGVGLLNGDASSLHIEAGVSESSPLAINIGDLTGVLGDVDLSSSEAASDSIAIIDSTLDTIATEQANVGAISNRFESAAASLATATLNLSAAKSMISDVDIAIEMATLTKNKLLLQAQIKALSSTYLISKSTFNLEV